MLRKLTNHMRRYNMDVRDEFNQSNIKVPSAELIAMLIRLKTKKEQEIEEIKTKILRYEKERRAEEAFYQSLSSFRKIFTGRPPSHHLAVEYMVHVKKRLKLIDDIKQRTLELDEAIDLVEGNPTMSEIVLSRSIFDELMVLNLGENDKNDH
jgi:acetyl-CoA carboxylase alpha subunit